LNSGFAAEAVNATAGRYAVLLAGVVSVALRGGFLRLDRFTFFTIVLGLFFIGHAVVFSPIPDVSILKALNWMLAMVTLLAAWEGLDAVQRDELQRWLFGYMLAVGILSLPFIAVPGIGYLRNGSGFQGILNHPQAFGPTMALLGALVFGRLLAQRRPPLRLAVLALGCLILVMMSEARTAGVALLLSVTSSLVLVRVLSGRKIRSIAPALRSKRLAGLALAGLIAAVAAGSQLSGAVNHYITKSGRAQVGGLAEAYYASRGMLMLQMIDNIKDKPWTGSGFGIASDPFSMDVSRDPILGLPVSASVEKGVVPLVILEEVGIPGFALAVIWVWVLVRRAAVNGMPTLVVATTALLMNMGEAVLFSPGGMGMLTLILLANAASKSRASSRRAIANGTVSNHA